MRKHTLIYIACIAALGITASGCKKQLAVGNPNAPTLEANVSSESGLESLAQGGVYVNGFANGDGWLGDSYFSLPWGYNELMADNVGAEASNNQITTIGVPDYIILDNGTKLTNAAPQVSIIRAYNNRASTGASNNPLYYQWLNMYALNNACNVVLDQLGKITFSGDAATKENTIKAWCYWWKGYAYASIGTMYYSGLTIDSAYSVSSNYQLHDAIIEHSNEYLNKAADALKGISNTADYNNVLGKLIPAFCQTGNGGVLTTDMWLRNINTMLARNIVLNKLAPFVNGNLNATISKSSTTAMTAADWNSVLSLTANGIKKGDYVFTGRSVTSNGFFSANGGSVAAMTTGPNESNTFKISERFMQNFKSGDKRVTNNFVTTSVFKNDYTFATRYSMVDGGTGVSGTYTYGSRTVGDYEVYIGPSYEENALMLAEADIRTGATEAGLALIDAVRSYQGSGVSAVAGTGLSASQAMQELVMERRVALVFRGVSFFDSRRWGWIYDISAGGGSYGNHVYQSGSGLLNTKVTINYNYMDYWDVPADESVLNPPGDGSAAVTNPNY
ncbi:MAG TPA: RagB/SusD family nutrient uptake outer membrane protein [Chitinophagaceae bacterium]|nr:RagB/SusD family nutrient uptake outer membrane protein [Chitinophagaceae bacterium]